MTGQSSLHDSYSSLGDSLTAFGVSLYEWIPSFASLVPNVSTSSHVCLIRAIRFANDKSEHFAKRVQKYIQIEKNVTSAALTDST